MRNILEGICKLKNKNKHKNEALKKSITIEKKDNHFHIFGELSNENYIVKGLKIQARRSDNESFISNTSKAYKFDFELNFYSVLNTLESDYETFDLFLIVQVPKEILNENKVLNIENKRGVENGYIDSLLRLGKFSDTTFNAREKAEYLGNQIKMYVTVKGNFSISCNNELENKFSFKTSNIKIKNQKFKLQGVLFGGNTNIQRVKLLALGRNSSQNFERTLRSEELTNETKKNYGLSKYQIGFDIRLDDIMTPSIIREDIFDLFFLIWANNSDTPIRLRIGAPKLKRKKFGFNNKIKNGNITYAITPYFTVKKFNLSLQVDQFNTDTYNYLKRMMRCNKLVRLLNVNQKIWVIGERPYKAQDTGYHFFKYMRENFPDKKVYYVIEEGSPEFDNVKRYGNYLIYKSKDHIKKVLLAKWLIGSHHVDYIYPSRTDEFKEKVKGKKAFLQHGVLGTKNTVHFYGKKSPSFNTDLFFVSSEYEKSIVVNDFGYSNKEVKVTGLSRFDNLFKNDIPLKRQILIIPTWREWLVSANEFRKSEYFERYLSLLSNSKLEKTAKNYNFEIVFCLHPNMQNYTSYFRDLSVKVISQGEVDVQLLMKESILMVTDYSSVAFDFSFLKKPVVYYQFDRERFIGKRGSHLDLDNDLPGEIVSEEEDVIDLIEKYAQQDFVMDREYERKSRRFLTYKDENSSERIYEAIRSFKTDKTSVLKKLTNSRYFTKLFKKYRKSKLYFPSMKLFFKIAKKILPINKNLILFESGIGKHYADSPRYIYEEILRRDLPYEKVWVYNKKQEFSDSNTKVVKRLSPSYYYYLAKAAFWVNNQNFPTYIKKRKQTTYIQTWHGTPLKKMLFDIERVQGRSEDYVERVYSATQTWDYLISPSSFASKAFRSAFKYKGNILEIGYPRNDIFYSEDKNKIELRTRRNLGIPKDKKVILYAPTFRDNQVSSKNKFTFDIKLDLEKMKEELGNEYVILLRMHVVVSNKIVIPNELKHFVYNVSDYPDIQELYLISDILITDYSSVMFDFANTGKPILFFTFDLDLYRDKTRGFYINFEEEAPGPLLMTSDEVLSGIQNIDMIQKEHQDRYNRFFIKYCSLEDGKASARIVDKFFET